MVVPHDDLRHLGDETPHVRVGEVVLVAAAEIVDRLGDLRLRLRHHVAPQRAVVQPHFRQQRLVGVDRVADVDEDVGLGAAHGLVQPQPAPVHVDAPALPDRVGRPRDRHVARARHGCCRRVEAAGDRLAPRAEVREVLVEDAVEDALPGRQVGERQARREIRRLERRRAAHAPRVGESFGSGELDEHPRGAIRLAPDDRAPAADVTRRDAEGDLGSRAGCADDGRRLPGSSA